MLDFTNMETKRLNDIVNESVKNKLSDVQFLEREITKWLYSPQRRCMIDAMHYYDHEQSILHKKRMILDRNGDEVEDNRLSNNKFLDNQYATMVDQKVNYLLSKPLTFNSDNHQYVEVLQGVFDKRFHKLLKNLGKDSYNGGIGWLYPYYDEQGQFRIKKFKPYEILPFWKDDDHEELDFAVRYYELLGYEGSQEKIYKYVDVYDTKGIHKFTFDNGQLRSDYQTYYFELPNLKGDTIPYNWDKVPLIPFKSNNNETSLLKRCKPIQDGINQILSDFADGMQDNANGSSILVLTNYDGTDLGEFRHNLSQYRVVKVSSVDGSQGGVSSMTIEVNAQNYLTILSELRRALIVNCRGYDINELKSAGSPNEMTIKSVYSQIDLDANELETEYQASFEQLMYFVNFHLATTGKGNFYDEKLDIIFDRDMMINESQVIADVNASSAILSKKTYLAQHPYVHNVDDEIKQLEEEQDQAMEQFRNSEYVKEDIDERQAEDVLGQPLQSDRTISEHGDEPLHQKDDEQEVL